jgi:hypothetical protein
MQLAAGDNDSNWFCKRYANSDTHPLIGLARFEFTTQLPILALKLLSGQVICWTGKHSDLYHFPLSCPSVESRILGLRSNC